MGETRLHRTNTPEVAVVRRRGRDADAVPPREVDVAVRRAGRRRGVRRRGRLARRRPGGFVAAAAAAAFVRRLKRRRAAGRLLERGAEPFDPLSRDPGRRRRRRLHLRVRRPAAPLEDVQQRVQRRASPSDDRRSRARVGRLVAHRDGARDEHAQLAFSRDAPRPRPPGDAQVEDVLPGGDARDARVVGVEFRDDVERDVEERRGRLERGERDVAVAVAVGSVAVGSVAVVVGGGAEAEARAAAAKRGVGGVVAAVAARGGIVEDAQAVPSRRVERADGRRERRETSTTTTRNAAPVERRVVVVAARARRAPRPPPSDRLPEPSRVMREVEQPQRRALERLQLLVVDARDLAHAPTRERQPRGRRDDDVRAEGVEDEEEDARGEAGVRAVRAHEERGEERDRLQRGEVPAEHLDARGRGGRRARRAE
eukprot:18182-Pelagococcus_subviridis.AAC.2